LKGKASTEVIIRVAILKYEKIAKFAAENSQNGQLIF
jgi:hypothetical protein